MMDARVDSTGSLRTMSKIEGSAVVVSASESGVKKNKKTDNMVTTACYRASRFNRVEVHVETVSIWAK